MTSDRMKKGIDPQAIDPSEAIEATAEIEETGDHEEATTEGAAAAMASDAAAVAVAVAVAVAAVAVAVGAVAVGAEDDPAAEAEIAAKQSPRSKRCEANAAKQQLSRKVIGTFRRAAL
jgi:hypothetical protein